MKATDQILTVARAYCATTRLSLSRVSTLVFNDGKKLGLIEKGGGLTTDSFERAMEWFSSNWLDGEAPWPDSVPRPAKAAA